MKFAAIVLLLFIGASCSEDVKPEAPKLKLDTYNKKISYLLGVNQAKNLLREKGMHGDELNKAELLKGFKENFSSEEPKDCSESMFGLYGRQGTGFNVEYVDEFSTCFGRVIAFGLFSELTQFDNIQKIDKEILFQGFDDGLKGKDTLLMKASEQRTIYGKYVTEIQTRIQEEEQSKAMANISAGDAWWADVKARSGVKEIGKTGIYIETVTAGTGGKPSAGSDLEVNYTLTNALGDTLESSFNSPQSAKFNLNGVIQGWQESLTEMKKGGTYRIFVPSEKAYQGGPLCFLIQLIDYGPAGSIAPPRN